MGRYQAKNSKVLKSNALNTRFKKTLCKIFFLLFFQPRKTKLEIQNNRYRKTRTNKALPTSFNPDNNNNAAAAVIAVIKVMMIVSL